MEIIFHEINFVKTNFSLLIVTPIILKIKIKYITINLTNSVIAKYKVKKNT